MEKMINFLKGYRTYIIGAVAIILGVLQGFEVFIVPDAVWDILAGLGLVTLRLSVNSVAKAVKPDAVP